jgi:tRNA-splicing ligase RtcB
MRALFHEGLLGWIDSVSRGPLGVLAGSDFAQISAELERVHLGGALDGHARWAPEDLAPAHGRSADGGMATIGGGTTSSRSRSSSRSCTAGSRTRGASRRGSSPS